MLLSSELQDLPMEISCLYFQGVRGEHPGLLRGTAVCLVGLVSGLSFISSCTLQTWMEAAPTMKIQV
jgi:hypothetical protein